MRTGALERSSWALDWPTLASSCWFLTCCLPSVVHIPPTTWILSCAMPQDTTQLWELMWVCYLLNSAQWSHSAPVIIQAINRAPLLRDTVSTQPWSWLFIFLLNNTIIILVNVDPSSFLIRLFSSVQSLSHVWPCDPMNRSTPGLPVHHQLPKFTQTHVHQVGDAIQPSHPLSSPSPPAPNPSQPSGSFPISQLFTWGGQSIGVSASASVLPMKPQDWSPLGWTGWISLESKGLSRVFSNTTVQSINFFGTQHSSQSNSHIHTWPLEKP